jgi:protein-tyrosine phosphatase
MAFEPSIFVVEPIGSGFLAVMARPVPGEWVDDEFAKISAFGIRRIVSLLELTEAKAIGLEEEGLLCERHSMEFVSYPIPDRGLPGSIADFAAFTRSLHESIGKGTNTVIHCRAGIGRTGVVAAGILLHAAFDAETAFDHITKARGMAVPDTEEQRQWIINNQHAILTQSQNRVGMAGLRLPPLPHHPACGSAPGGSNKTR